MPSVPKTSISSLHIPGAIFELRYTGYHPTTPIIFAANTRTEMPLSGRNIHLAPARGKITRIQATEMTGAALASFELDIVDLPYGTGVVPSPDNIVFRDDAVITIVNTKLHLDALFDIAYELDSRDTTKRSLFVGIKPNGGPGVFNVKVYIESRS